MTSCSRARAATCREPPRPKEGIAFRDAFSTRHRAQAAARRSSRSTSAATVHGIAAEPRRERTCSRSCKRQSGDRTFYVVIEDDLSHLVGRLFPQFFASATEQAPLPGGRRARRARLRPPFVDVTDELAVERPFVDTVDGWVLRVAEKDIATRAELAAQAARRLAADRRRGHRDRRRPRRSSRSRSAASAARTSSRASSSRTSRTS